MLLLLVCVALVTNSAAQASPTFCPPGYKAKTGRCFKYLNANMKHANAMETCEYYHAGKAIDIKSLEDDKIASAVMGPDAFTESLWLSITDDNLDGIFKYPDESPTATYTPWDSIPDSSTQKACALRNQVKSVITWQASDCTTTAKTICEVPSIGNPCADGWVYNHGGDITCLRPIRRVRRNYVMASGYCQRLGGGLAIHVTSYAQRKRVLKKVKFRGHFFIGIDDVDNDGTYEYKDGTALTEYRPFKNGRPGPGRCVTVKKRRWFPKDCNKIQHFICEKLAFPPEFEPIFDKNPPLTTAILGGIDPGKIIIIKGVSTANAARFTLNLMCGRYSTTGDRSLHFDVRFDYASYTETIVMNLKTGGQWGSDRRKQLDTDFPFAIDVPFEIMILIKATSHKIAVNGQHFTDFQFPVEAACGDHLNVVGDIYMTEIRFE